MFGCQAIFGIHLEVNFHYFQESSRLQHKDKNLIKKQAVTVGKKETFGILNQLL